MLTLEEGLQDLDGADGVDVDVGDDQDPIVGTEQVEKFFSQIGDEHFSDNRVNFQSMDDFRRNRTLFNPDFLT